MAQFNGVTITPETIQQTRQHFADNCRRAVEDAETGVVLVNDLRRYVSWQVGIIADVLAGKSDHTFTFLQRAHWLQTGECIPLLPKTESVR